MGAFLHSNATCTYTWPFFLFLTPGKKNGGGGRSSSWKRVPETAIMGKEMPTNCTFSLTYSKALLHCASKENFGGKKRTKMQRCKMGIKHCGFLGPMKELWHHQEDHKKTDSHTFSLCNRSLVCNIKNACKAKNYIVIIPHRELSTLQSNSSHSVVRDSYVDTHDFGNNHQIEWKNHELLHFFPHS